MKRKWKKGIQLLLKEEKGETIAETLAAVLVISLAMTMLAGAIMTSANINATTKKMKTEFDTTGAIAKDSTVSIQHADGQPDDTIEVTSYTTKDDNSYVYYETK